MPFTIRARLTGVEDLVRSLDDLKRSVRTRILRKAVTKGARLILNAAKGKVPVQSGLEKKSLGTFIRVYGGVVLAVIGPRTGMKERVVVTPGGKGAILKTKRGARLALKRGSYTRMEDPAKIGHLLEGGTKPHAIGEGSSLRKKIQQGGQHPGSPAYRFMQRAIDEQRAAATAAMRNSIAEDLAKLAVKMRAAA